MATITNREDVDKLIDNAGVYPGDEDSFTGPVVRIVEYKNQAGETIFGVVYEIEAAKNMLDRYDHPSQYIRNPKVIWRHAEWIS
jgi:hypothetical protein